MVVNDIIGQSGAATAVVHMIPRSGNRELRTRGILLSLDSHAGDSDDDCVVSGISIIEGKSEWDRRRRCYDLTLFGSALSVITKTYGSGTFHLS